MFCLYSHINECWWEICATSVCNQRISPYIPIYYIYAAITHLVSPFFLSNCKHLSIILNVHYCVYIQCIYKISLARSGNQIQCAKTACYIVRLFIISFMPKHYCNIVYICSQGNIRLSC